MFTFVAAHHHLFAFLAQVFRLCVWLVLLTALFAPLERLFHLRRQPLWRRDTLTDLAYYFLSSLVPGLLLAAPLAFIATTAHAAFPAAYIQMVSSLPAWAVFAIALVVGEIGFYWGHRWSHEVPLLWRFHSIHHSADEMDFLVNTRAHPVDMVFGRLCGLAPLYALGLGSSMSRAGGLIPVLVILVGAIWGFFIHANLRWRFGPLEHLLATPVFHHWHHTNDAHRDRNYASLLPGVDALFGTLHLPKRAWPTSYGIDTPMPQHLTDQLLHPFERRP